jgi:hypothetical protein
VEPDRAAHRVGERMSRSAGTRKRRAGRSPPRCAPRPPRE